MTAQKTAAPYGKGRGTAEPSSLFRGAAPYGKGRGTAEPSSLFRGAARLALAFVLASLSSLGRAGEAPARPGSAPRPAVREALVLLKSPHYGLDELWARTAVRPEMPRAAGSLKEALALLAKPEAIAPLRAALAQDFGERQAADFESAAKNLPAGIREQLGLIAARLERDGKPPSELLEEVYAGGSARKEGAASYPVFTISQRADMPLPEVQDVVRVILDVNALAAGPLDIPARADLRISRFSERFFGDLYGTLTLGRRGAGEPQDGEFRARPVIAHEWGHVLFTHNFRLAGGERLGARLAGAQRRLEALLPPLSELGNRGISVSNRYRRLKLSGKEAQAAELLLFEDRLTRKRNAANEAWKRALAERERIFNPFRAYNELFADCVGVLLDGNPRAMIELLRLRNFDLPSKEYQAYIEQRDFLRDPGVRLYDLDPDDDYTLLNHARHHLWTHYFSKPAYRDRKGVLLARLLEAMNQEGNARLREASMPGYAELNERLIRRFDALSGEKHDARVRLERSESAYAGKL